MHRLVLVVFSSQLGTWIGGQDDEGRSVLHWAVDGGHTELAQALLDRGANPQLKVSDAVNY